MADFDYSAAEISADELASVVADIRNTRPKPLSDIDRIEHERFMADVRWRAEQQRIERERQRAEAEAARQAEAQRQAALARAQEREKLRQDTAERNRRTTHDRTLSGLLDAAIDQRQFRQQALRSHAHAAARQRLRTVLNPPEPTPLPQPAPEAEQIIDRESMGSPYRFAPDYNPNYFRDVQKFRP